MSVAVHLHLAVELPKVLCASILGSDRKLAVNRHKVVENLALLGACVLEVLGLSSGSGGATVQVEDELLGQLRDRARQDDDLLPALVLGSAAKHGDRPTYSSSSARYSSNVFARCSLRERIGSAIATSAIVVGVVELPSLWWRPEISTVVKKVE